MLSSTELGELFEYYPMLATLPSPLAQRLPHDGQRFTAGAGQVIFDVGSPCHSFLSLTSGSIRVVKPSASGHELLLYRLQPGDSCILTTSCLLGHAHYPARGVAESDLSGFSLSGAYFREMVERSVAFRNFVFEQLAERLTRLMELVEEVTFRSLEQRLAALLLAQGPTIRTTHQTLADELGSAREVISRTLEAFEAQGLVRLERRQIHILDQAALRRILLAP